jgi:CDP-glycerol glycerophosphotransferase
MNDRKMILWMPTFRQSGVLDSAENAIQLPFPLPGVYNEGELRELDDHLNKRDILLVIKKHPVQSAWNLDEKRYRNIRFVTQDGEEI